MHVALARKLASLRISPLKGREPVSRLRHRWKSRPRRSTRREQLGPHHADHDQRSEEHTSELQSLMRISYAGFCLKKNTIDHNNTPKKQRQIRPNTQIN